MARASRGAKGPSLLIPMIVVIVGWLVLSYFAYDSAQKNKIQRETYQELRAELMRYQVQQNFNRVEQEMMARPIGFSGPSPITNAVIIHRLINRMKQQEPTTFYNVSDATRALGTIDLSDHTRKPTLPAGFDSTTRAVFENAVDIEGIIAAQDVHINELLDANRNLQLSIINNRAATDSAHEAEVTDTRRVMAARDQGIAANRQRLQGSVGEADEKTKDFDDKSKDLADYYGKLWTAPELLERYRSIKKAQGLRDQVNREANEAADAVTTLAPRLLRPVTERDHYDGTIYFVDTVNKWAYINLGRKDGVKSEMTFNVVRYVQADQPLQLGIIQIKEVMSDRSSWCTILTTLDPKVQMQPGDRIIDAGYFRTQHPQRYVLLGKFGSPYTAYSRDMTERMLTQAGFTVDEEITRYTEVIVLGAEYREDRMWIKAFGEDGTYAKYRSAFNYWRADEVYYFLGHPR